MLARPNTLPPAEKPEYGTGRGSAAGVARPERTRRWVRP